MIAPHTYLLDGPLSALPLTRERKIGDMATELLRQHAFGDRGDAIRVLRAFGHPFLDVFILVDEVIFECKQRIVAQEFSDITVPDESL